jgi:hypothetical protein
MAREAIRHRQVAAETEMVLVSVPGGLPVRARLRYTTQDPYALTMSFAIDECAPVEWVFARDLLVAGISRPSGVGDVHVFPTADRIVVDLASPDGAARLVADAGPLTRFVSKMLAAVPLGAEDRYSTIDDELAALCSGTMPPMETPLSGGEATES